LTLKGVDAVANILKQEGVDFIGCIPFNTLVEAAAVAGVRPIIFRQERVGVNAADGFSRVANGRRTGVFTMQAQAGAENGFPGVAQAYADSVPILLLPASDRRSRIGVRPTFSPTRSYREVTKWVDQINLVERVPEMMRRAFSHLRTGRPSPVMLELPSDVMASELDESLLYHYVPVKPRRTEGDPQDIAEAAKAILAARRPVIHAGQGILYAEAWEELRELAELLQAPVMTTLAGKSAFPEDHPLSIGAGGMSTTGPVVHFLREADLVFGIGCSFNMTIYGVNIPPGKVMVHSTNDESDINKDYHTDHAIIGDAKLTLRQLLQEIRTQAGPEGRRNNEELAREVRAVKDEWMKEWMPKLTSDEVPINPYRVIWDLMQAVDRRQTIVTHDSGSPRDQMSPFYETISPRGFIGWGKSTQLGYGLGLAMGAKLAAPEKLAVSVMGDAAFGMVGLDLETAVREQIPTLTIVLNNSRMGIYGPDAFPVARERYGTGRLSGNYAEVAQAMGGYNERIEKPEDVIPAIRRGQQVVASGQTALLEIITKHEGAFSYKAR
jgi:acetolactate synthase-1/2/3 large subunit